MSIHARLATSRQATNLVQMQQQRGGMRLRGAGNEVLAGLGSVALRTPKTTTASTQLEPQPPANHACIKAGSHLCQWIQPR